MTSLGIEKTWIGIAMTIAFPENLGKKSKLLFTVFWRVRNTMSVTVFVYVQD
jgi:hypothetical protein